MDLRSRMADDAPEGVSDAVQFRDDILRGVRLGLIAFAAILIGVWAYRMLRPPSDVQGATQLEAPPTPEAPPSQDPAPHAAPITEASSESHGLVVPPPPPMGGKERVAKVARPKVVVPSPAAPPTPAVARTHKAPVPSGREFETGEPGALPASPSEESADSSAAAPKKGVGYKSLLEADPNRAQLDPSLLGQPEPEKPKGNRFFRAVGKIFRPGGKKETVPLTLQQPKQ